MLAVSKPTTSSSCRGRNRTGENTINSRAEVPTLHPYNMSCFLHDLLTDGGVPLWLGIEPITPLAKCRNCSKGDKTTQVQHARIELALLAWEASVIPFHQ